MTLGVALLRRDFLIVAADRRHTRGDQSANYKDDCDIKLMPFLEGRAILGYAGTDLCEQIAVRAMNKRLLERSSLEEAAYSLATFAESEYAAYVPNHRRQILRGRAPHVEFLIGGFDRTADGSEAATAYVLPSQSLSPFRPLISQHPYVQFAPIGRSSHGALYGLHRFARETQDIQGSLRLAAFVFAEIMECDTTTGGLPQMYVIRRGERAEQQRDDLVAILVDWAKQAGALLGESMVRDTN